MCTITLRKITQNIEQVFKRECRDINVLGSLD